MLDLELLRSFVSVVDSGGFTRAGERVHRTQSTVSQQIKRLEDDIGQPLLNRTGKSVTPTEAGERLLSYARRLLALAEEARDVLARPTNEGAVRLGIPEDFAAYRLAKLLASCSRSRPGLRLDVRADQSVFLRRDLDRGELDLALLKRDAGEKGGIAVWPERVHWVTSKSRPVDTTSGSVPLIGFPPGCLYRARAIHALESAGRAWHMAYASSGLAGIQAAVAAGLGLSILSEMSIPGRPSHAHRKRRLRADRQDRGSADGITRRQPRDIAARRPPRRILQQGAGEGGVALVLQHGRCTPLPLWERVAAMRSIADG
jgi:DNA-binding transcriptional LysR family regulator